MRQRAACAGSISSLQRVAYARWASGAENAAERSALPQAWSKPALEYSCGQRNRRGGARVGSCRTTPASTRPYAERAFASWRDESAGRSRRHTRTRGLCGGRGGQTRKHSGPRKVQYSTPASMWVIRLRLRLRTNPGLRFVHYCGRYRSFLGDRRRRALECEDTALGSSRLPIYNCMAAHDTHDRPTQTRRQHVLNLPPLKSRLIDTKSYADMIK